MANPRKKNGYTPIANEIMDALALIKKPSPYEWNILMFLLRKTYGWNKKEDKCAYGNSFFHVIIIA